MTAPVTTLRDIVLLAHQQYGIRFQLTQQQLVDFVNMIQFIAYNNDLAAFEEWDQIFYLGQDVFLEFDSGSYTAPSSTDLRKTVLGSVSGTVGTLMNYHTLNRRNIWIIEPPDGGTLISLTDGEILTISGGTSATGVVATGQSYLVSNGPYLVPSEEAGNPPFRKLIGVTQVTDQQFFGVPGIDNPSNADYGLALSVSPRTRNAYYPFRFDMDAMEITLITSTRPEIIQTKETYGAGATTQNSSRLRWVYYRNPPTITSISDEAKLVLPERYRYEVLYKGISKLADTATFGDAESIRAMIVPICARFWEDMGTQYQGYGPGSDWISETQ